jgi:hypothetical protein
VYREDENYASAYRARDIRASHGVSQKELLEQNAAQQQKLLSEFQAALGKSQTAWLSLTASGVAFTAAICTIFVRVIHWS